MQQMALPAAMWKLQIIEEPIEKLTCKQESRKVRLILQKIYKTDKYKHKKTVTLFITISQPCVKLY